MLQRRVGQLADTPPQDDQPAEVRYFEPMRNALAGSFLELRSMLPLGHLYVRPAAAAIGVVAARYARCAPGRPASIAKVA